MEYQTNIDSNDNTPYWWLYHFVENEQVGRVTEQVGLQEIKLIMKALCHETSSYAIGFTDKKERDKYYNTPEDKFNDVIVNLFQTKQNPFICVPKQ